MLPHRNVVPDSIRAKIVDFVLHKGETKAAVAKRLDYPWSTVDSIVRKKTGLELSQTSTRTALRDRLHVMLKRTNVEHDRHNSPEMIAACQAWVQAFRTQGHTLDEAVFLDEAGFHLQQTRNIGRAAVGQHATQRNWPYNRRPNLSLLVAIDHNGIQAHCVKTGAWNSTSLVEFFQEQVLPRFEGQPKVFVLDNARFHHSPQVIQAVQGAGHHIQYLPPYLPWFNIAEKVFAKVKPFVSCQDLQDSDDIHAWIYTLLSTITPDMARGWIHETNRWMVVAEHGHPLGNHHDAEAALRHHSLYHKPAPIDPQPPS